MAEAVDAPGALKGPPGEAPSVIIDNRTGLPDEAVREAIMAQWVETAALQFAEPSSFQLYATGSASMLNRSPFRAPTNVIEEIKLARQLVDTDDDIQAIVGQAIATAFGDGMENQHPDEGTLRLFNRICGPKSQGGMDMDSSLKELYREYLIAGQFTTVQAFTRTRFNFVASDGTRVNSQLSTPLLGVLPAEHIRVTSNDLFGTGSLAYDVTDDQMRRWLDELFAKTTTEARRAQMRREEPFLAALFTGSEEVSINDSDLFSRGKRLYTLNQRMVHRTTMPKGASPYPRPPLTASFALLEAKRLLNIMDYALLQGGTNYIVVAKVGSDQRPAQQPEVDNLVNQVRVASRTGVLVGDHRVSIDIITPNLSELLNPAKRKLIGRKLAMALLRIPEQVTDDPGAAGAGQELEFTARTITSDRLDIKRHVEGYVYDEIIQRNPSSFTKGAPALWFPKIVLSGLKDFFDQVVKARDRGDIPRKWAVELLGFDYEAGVAQRKREQENGDDEVLKPGSVPYSPQDGRPPADVGPGRPPGSSSNNGRPGSPDQQQTAALIARGEAIIAQWDAEAERQHRVGALTAAVLEEYPEHTVGRVTQTERDAVASGEPYQHGPVAVVPVNVEWEVGELRAFRLDEGLSMIVGERDGDGALVARALCFREPHFDAERAVETAMRWGFYTGQVIAPERRPDEPPPAPPSVGEVIAQALREPGAMQAVVAALGEVFAKLQPSVTVVMPEEGDKEVLRDEETGAIVGVRRRAPQIQAGA